MLTVKNLSFRRESSEIFEKINLRVSAGEIVGVRGPSGCGKTTLLRCIAGLEDPEGGEVLLDGIKLDPKKIGFVFQDHGLWSLKKAIDNITLPLTLVHGLSVKVARDRAEVLLKDLDIYHRADAYPPELSGGEKQRLAFARALAIQPQILVLDEPSASLDQQRSLNLKEILQKEKSKGVAVLMATHDSQYLPIFDRIYEFEGKTLHQTKGSSP